MDKPELLVEIEGGDVVTASDYVVIGYTMLAAATEVEGFDIQDPRHVEMSFPKPLRIVGVKD